MARSGGAPGAPAAAPQERAGGGAPVPLAMAKAWRPYGGAAAQAGSAAIYLHEPVTQGGAGGGSAGPGPGTGPIRPARVAARRRRLRLACGSAASSRRGAANAPAPASTPLPALPEPGLGGELMCSTLVAGPPEACLAALTHPASASSLLGPAFQTTVLDEGPGYQVRARGRAV
jgi:hypothetical protein